MSACPQHLETLMDYVYGELEDPAPFERHLAACPACREEVEALRGVRATVHDNTARVASPYIATRIKARLRERHERRTWWERLLPAYRVAFASCLALVICLAGYFTMRTRDAAHMSAPAESAAGIPETDLLLREAADHAAAGRHAEALQKSRSLLRDHADFPRRDEAYTIAIRAAQALGDTVQADALEAERTNLPMRK